MKFDFEPPGIQQYLTRDITRGQSNLVLSIGALLLLSVAIYAFMTGPSLSRDQKESFQVAAHALSSLPLQRPLTMQDAILASSGNQLSWRGILYISENGAVKPKIWVVDTEKEKDGFKIVKTTISDYEREAAHLLEIFREPDRPASLPNQ